MNINLSAVIIDAADLEPETAFWHRLLGGSIAKTATRHFLRIDGFPVFVIQLAPGHVPPQWPEDNSQQMHVDLTTDDLAAANRLALEAGARRLHPTEDVDPASQKGGRVYASPAGHPFCLRSALRLTAHHRALVHAVGAADTLAGACCTAQRGRCERHILRTGRTIRRKQL